MRPEFDIIVAALKANFSGLEQFSFDVESSDFDKIDVEQLFSLAIHHGCVWEVAAFCKFHHLLSDKQLTMVSALTMQSTVQSMQNETGVLQTVEMLEQKKVPYAILKGATIFPQFRTASDQVSRQSADIDILVDAEDVATVVQELIAYGFISDEVNNPLLVADFINKSEQWFQARDMSFSHQEKAVNIDLHWRVAYSFSLPMVTKELLSRIEQVEIQDREMNCLSFNDHFILLCIHGYLDKFFILKHLVDIYWAKHHPRFDFDAICLLANKYGVIEQVKSACATADLFFKVSDDSEQMSESSHYADSVWERFIQYQFQPPRMHPGHEKWSLRDKIAYIQHQSHTRSQLKGALSPVFHRLKFDERMLVGKPSNFPLWLWWALSLLRKVCRI